MPSTIGDATGRVATYSRMGDRDKERIARQDLAEAVLTRAIERRLAAAPPLRPEQVEHLAGLLTGSRDDHTGTAA